MDKLKGLEPASVFDYFERICQIPHGSGNTAALGAFCADFAKKRNLEHYVDALGNVIIIKPATPGYERAEPLIIQGHLDMVCEKETDCDFDFSTEPLRLCTVGGCVTAEGTTLGGDDGIAIAMALAILDSTTLIHPRIEAVFTVDEETGMFGAEALDLSRLRGRMLLNIDSEEEGVLTVSCAGGVRVNCTLNISRESYRAARLRLVIGGLRGGHSGTEIDKGRASANQLMGRLLNILRQSVPFRLVSLSGGAKDNAIPCRAVADLMLSAAHLPAAEAILSGYGITFKSEYAAVDPGVFVSFSSSEDSPGSALTQADTDAAVYALLVVPYGVQDMSADIPGLVQTSLNLGTALLSENAFTLSFSIRSSVPSRKKMLIERLEAIFRRLGGKVTLSGDYPAWEYRQNSPLRDLTADTYRTLFGKEPRIEAIHAGLECGFFCAKRPGLDCVSIGPDIRDIHTPAEALDIASTGRVWAWVCAIIESLAQNGK